MRIPRRLPAQVRARIREALGPEGEELGLNFDRAYYLDTSLAVGIWIVWGRGVICLFNGHSFSMACDTSIRATQDGLVIVSGPSPAAYERPAVVALGLVPDGVHAVRLGLLGGRDRVVPVVRNTFALRAHRPIMVKDVRR
jgi:hypothetical protein